MSDTGNPACERTYSITEVEQLSGLAAHTLRWYEQLGLIGDVARGPGGRRAYTGLHLRWLQFLAAVRATRMSIADMKRYVALAREGRSTVPDRRLMIELHRDRLRQQSEELAVTLRYLDWKIGLFKQIEAGEADCPSDDPFAAIPAGHPATLLAAG
jgi:DNA-binding transcriptional MerR regulator